jgi:hypothetical protein
MYVLCFVPYIQIALTWDHGFKCCPTCGDRRFDQLNMPFAAPEMISQSITQKTINWINHHNQADAETNKATTAFIGKTGKSCVWTVFKSFFQSICGLNAFFNTNPFLAKSTLTTK